MPSYDSEKIKKLRNQFEKLIKSGVKTIAELPSGPKCYVYLKPYIKDLLEKEKLADDIIFTYMLVQFVRREYNGNDFYSSFCSAMGCKTKDKVLYIKKHFEKAINDYKLLDFGYLDGRKKQFVECIKAHSFCYFVKQEKILEASEKIHEWLGHNIQDKDIVKRELFYIQEKIKKSLSAVSNDDDIKITFGDDNENQSTPRLYLPVSTCRFFSDTSTDSLMSVFYPILQMIDNRYYPDDEPNPISENMIDWIKSSYDEWEKKQNKASARAGGNGQKPPYRNHTPYIKIKPDTSDENFKIVIPEITKEAPENSERWYCVIKQNGKTVNEPKELTISDKLLMDEITFWKTRETKIEIDWKMIFDELSVIVFQPSNDDNRQSYVEICSWKISSGEYRLFDKDGYQIKKIQAGKENILLVKPGSTVCERDVDDFRRSPTEYFDKYNFTAHSNGAVKIGGSLIISVAGQYCEDPFFAQKRDSFLIKKDEAFVTAAARHPIISIKCSKIEEGSIKMNLNGENRRLEKGKYSVIDDAFTPGGVIVTIPIEHFADNKDGVYTVEYGISGKPLKSYTYVILQYLSFEFSEPRYYNTDCELKISREHNLKPVKNEFYSLKTLDACSDSYWWKYKFDIKPQCEEIGFNITDMANVELIIPVPKAIFGFKYDFTDAIFFNQEWSVPFTQIGNTMYTVISGVESMTLECNGKNAEGMRTNPKSDVFKFDLTDIKNTFRTGIPNKMRICYYDTKERSIPVLVHSVKPQEEKDYLSVIGSDVFYRLDDIPKGASCYFDIFSEKSDGIPLKSVPLCVGSNQKIADASDLESNITYWYSRRIETPNVVPGLPPDSWLIDRKRLPLIVPDVNNLIDHQMDILDKGNKYLFRYTVLVTKKDATGYLGYLYEEKKRICPIAVCDRRIAGDSISAKISAYAIERKRPCKLAYENSRLVPKVNDEPNGYIYTFDKKTFRKTKKGEH